MEVDFDVFDVDAIESKINTLEINLFSCENYGEKLSGSDQAIPVYKLTIKYLQELIKDVTKLEPYSKGYAKRLHKLINIRTYKSGTNLFIDQCIRATTEAERIISEG